MYFLNIISGRGSGRIAEGQMARLIDVNLSKLPGKLFQGNLHRPSCVPYIVCPNVEQGAAPCPAFAVPG